MHVLHHDIIKYQNLFDLSKMIYLPNKPVAKETNPRAMALSRGSTHLKVRIMEPTSEVEWMRTVTAKMKMYHPNTLHFWSQNPLVTIAPGGTHLQSWNLCCEKMLHWVIVQE